MVRFVLDDGVLRAADGHVDAEAEGADAWEDAEALAAATAVQLDDQSFAPAACARLARTLEGMPELTSVDLSCTELGGVDGAIAVLRSLQSCQALRRLQFSAACRFADVEADEDLSIALRDAVLALPELEDLSLADTSLTDVACLTVCQALVNSRSLKHLSLDWNALGPLAAESLAEVARACNTLTSIDLNENAIGDEGAASLLMTLPRATHVARLGLKNCKIQLHDDWDQIGDGSLSSDGLRSLILSRNHLHAAGTARLCRWLPRWPCLRTLYLRRNFISCDGARALFAVLPRCRALGVVDVGENGIREDGAAAIAEHLSRPDCALLRLDVSENPLGGAAAAVLSAAAASPSLSWIGFANCGGSRDAAADVRSERRLSIDFGDRATDDEEDDA